MLGVLFCLSMYSENKKDTIEVVLIYDNNEISYYYEYYYKDNSIILSVYKEE